MAVDHERLTALFTEAIDLDAARIEGEAVDA